MQPRRWLGTQPESRRSALLNYRKIAGFRKRCARSLDTLPKSVHLGNYRSADKKKTTAHAETVAMALAKTGRCEEAEWQREALAAARRADQDQVAERLQNALARYEGSGSCRQ